MSIDKDARRRCLRTYTAAAVVGLVLATAGVALGGPVPGSVWRFLDLSPSFASGVAGDLIVPIGSAATFSFDSGRVAIGDVPVALPERSGPRRRGRAGRPFLTPPGSGPRVRLLLHGVTDADGSLVSNTGNQLIIDAAVSSAGAAPAPQPFALPFDINAGLAWLDAPLPIQAPTDASVRVQIIGVTVTDPSGQAFATLGFEVSGIRPPTPPSFTPLATPTADAEGRCFKGPICAGPSVPLSQDECCRTGRAADGVANVTSWCPPDQFDPSTGQCAVAACQVCGPPPTATPGPCANLASCGGACSLTCADGTVVSGQCAPDQNADCQCTARCAAPTPCGIGECFDTTTSTCTNQPCDASLHCPLPNQVCDISGRRCPCPPPPPPLPQGHICCLCKDRMPACFDFSYVEVQPICPPGCESFLGQECDPAVDSCAPLTPCAADADCDDGNGCTVDRCTAAGCVHDCVCAGPGACQPGPARRPH